MMTLREYMLCQDVVVLTALGVFEREAESGQLKFLSIPELESKQSDPLLKMDLALLKLSSRKAVKATRVLESLILLTSKT